MKTNNPFQRCFHLAILFAAAFSICMLSASAAHAQVGAGGGGFGGGVGGGAGGDRPVGGQVPPVDTGQGGGQVDGGDAGGTAGGGAGEGDGQLESIEPTALDFDIIDRRNQGFVGPTAERITQQGFVGPPGQITGPTLAEEAFSFAGGGVNAGLGARSAINATPLQQNGFTVQRQGIRARLVPSFLAPRTPGFVAESRFQSRIVRQPVVRQLGQGVNVSVANRTATMTGFVRSNAERQILMRQLRLEPGVYRIVDRTTTAQ